ncbi:relaxase/mobilization nuclease domain-containing protein [Pedobacter psychrodurus]|uniref:relaxase/mobilization nuclease domain-containing protein n=1 Tax=Pedobacter psychrodurus TaxID=2530456 RepID=UPI0029314DF0|nr:relaxase/mobilization nuclease domain-containing protein [Pedobacter psychrodurus]
MIVQFLSSNSQFAAIKYNSDKLSCGKAELMSVRNFQALTTISKPRAADFKSYLQMIGSLNPKVKNKQLHVCIMAEGQSRTKNELTEIAHQWLKKMGYGDNPYLIYFHNDNPNNHVHMVSVRVCKDRKSVASRYEKFRASLVLHELIGFDPVAQAKLDAGKALRYGFTSLDQFLILLKNMGYSGYVKDSAVHMVKHSRTLHSIELNYIDLCIKHYQPSLMANKALRGVIELLLKVASGKPVRHPSFWHSYLRQRYRSDLAVLLKEKLNADIVYHAERKSIVGFTLINHHAYRVHDGKEIIDLLTLTKELDRPEGYVQGDEIMFYKKGESQDNMATPDPSKQMSVNITESEQGIARRGR